jgi:hypothetical protein
MFEEKLPRRVTIRLTPYQSRRLWKLRSADLPEGARPRTVTEVLVRALLDAARAIDRDEATGTTSTNEATPPSDGLLLQDEGPHGDNGAAVSELEVELPAQH